MARPEKGVQGLRACSRCERELLHVIDRQDGHRGVGRESLTLGSRGARLPECRSSAAWRWRASNPRLVGQGSRGTGRHAHCRGCRGAKSPALGSQGARFLECQSRAARRWCALNRRTVYQGSGGQERPSAGSRGRHAHCRGSWGAKTPRQVSRGGTPRAGDSKGRHVPMAECRGSAFAARKPAGFA